MSHLLIKDTLGNSLTMKLKFLENHILQSITRKTKADFYKCCFVMLYYIDRFL